LTAEDVKASIEFVQNPESQSSLAWLFANLDSVNVMDEYTVEWVLSQSDSIMQFVPATLGAAVAPKSQIDEKGLDLGTDPVGAGPWQLEEWQSGNYIQLSRHDNYWREGRPYLDTLTFNIEPSSSSRITGLQDQSIDTVDQFPSSQAQTIEQMSHVELYQDLISFGAAFFTFNQTKEPFDNRNVRRAVSYAIDTEQMTESIKGDYGRHAYSMIPEEMEFGHVGPDDLEYDGFPYDPEQARQLLDEEGITGDPRFETAIHVPNYDDTRQAARIIQEYLAEIQIDVEINEMTEQQHIQEWFGEPPENQGPMLFGDWVSDFPDPQPLLEPLYRTGTSNNWTGYSNEEVDEYLDTVRTSLDPEERAEAAKNANQQVVDDANYLWMWHPVHMRAMNNRYEGWIHRPPFFGYWATMFGTVYDSEQ
jgi:ABC-type transport system substrate-binding protein